MGNGASQRMTSSTTACGCGADDAGCAARHSLSCPVGRCPMGITRCVADNKPGTPSAVAVKNGSRPRLCAKIPLVCQIPVRFVAGLGAEWSASGVRQKPACGATALGKFCGHPPSLPGIGRRRAVFCCWRESRHELAGSRLTQTADPAVGLPTRTRMEGSPPVGWWPTVGVYAHCIPISGRAF